MEQKRQPKGTTIGGQFAASKNPESNLDLSDGSYSETNRWGDTRHYNSSGQLHRDGGLPAIEWADGSKHYYVNGHLHRDGGLPAIEDADGTKEYWVNGQRHNAHGLAIVARGAREYWLKGRQVSRAEWRSHPDVIAAKKSGDSVDEPPSE